MIVRPRKEGYYEIISDHRRKYDAIKKKAGRKNCGQVDHNAGKRIDLDMFHYVPEIADNWLAQQMIR